MSEISVWILDKIHDDPRFDGFGFEYKENPFTPKLPMKEWDAPRLAGVWKPTGVKGRVRPFNDFPGLSGNPAFSQRAVDALHDLLEPNGELIPFEASGRKYYAYNVTTVIEALDTESSQITYFRNSLERIIRIPHFEFDLKKLTGRSIFRIRQRPSEAFVTDIFVNRANEHGLKGFFFKKVWPLPRDTDWLKFSAEQRRERERVGLPVGQTIKGNSLRIELRLKGASASEDERQEIVRLASELSDIFIDMTSDAPQIGNLDDVRYLDNSSHLILNGPSANSMAEKMRPWLRMLHWPAGFKVVKHYGYADEPASEETVRLE